MRPPNLSGDASIFRSSGSGPPSGSSTGRYILTLRAGAHEEAREQLASAGLLAREFDAESVTKEREIPDVDVLLFPRLSMALLSGEGDQYGTVERITDEHEPGSPILSIEEESIVEGISTSDLPGNILPEDATVGWALSVMGITSSSVWTGRSVRVAILDTGLSRNHVDFPGPWPESRAQSFLFFNPSVEDDHGHGTHCAGVIAGPANPSSGPRYAVAPEAELFIAKVLNAQMKGAQARILSGIEWALANKCEVVSLSLGEPSTPGVPFHVPYETMAARAMTQGCLLVAAAGNDSRRPTTILPAVAPAECPSVLAVGSIAEDLTLSPDSNGSKNDAGGRIDVVGPGVAVRSAFLDSGYRELSGTSMAAAAVAGVAVLYRQAYKNDSIRQTWDRLRAGAQALALPPEDVGTGVVQAP